VAEGFRREGELGDGWIRAEGLGRLGSLLAGDGGAAPGGLVGGSWFGHAFPFKSLIQY
jgi:hypothetical protein